MMEERQTRGKVIAVSGPSFCGKTYLVSRLVMDFPQLHVISFEQHFIRNNLPRSYMNFYKDINQHVENGVDVISESVYSPTTNPIVRWTNPVLNVYCLPPMKEHLEYYCTYIKRYGRKSAELRSGGFSIRELRHRYLDHVPLKIRGVPGIVTYNGSDYENVKEGVKKHVDNR